MGLPTWLERHWHGILFVVVLLAAGGVAALLGLPVSLFPQVSFPRVEVNVEAGDRPADQMVLEVTRPLEEAVRGVPGVLHVRSNTSRGSCDISVEFRWGTEMIPATLQLESAVGQLLPDLPDGVHYEVRRMDPTVFPVMGVSLTSATRSQMELRDLALYVLSPEVATVGGVSRTRVLGGRSEEIQVLPDPGRLEALGLSLEDVVNAVSTANVLQAIGRLEEDEKLYLVLADSRVQDSGALGEIVLRRGSAGAVRLADVAQIEDTTAPEWTRTVADGREAVLVNIYQQPDGNTTRISRDIQDRLDELRGRLPADVEMSVWYDQSHLIGASARSVRDAIVIGILLAAIVILAFLRSGRITVIVAVAVPVVLASAALLLLLFGMGLNIMTLGGMAAAVGLVIDDAIVMVEHIIRRLREGAAEQGGAVERATSEMLPALTASSLATVVIFVPLAFLSGVTGAFFKALSLTMACSLIVSFLFAAAAVPVLARRILGPAAALAEDTGRWMTAALGAYERLLRGLLGRPALVLVGIVPLLVLGWLSFRQVGTGFMPAMDEGGFILDYRAPAGTSLTETDRRLRLLEGILAEIPEVETYSRRTGLALGGHITEVNEGDYFVRLRPLPRRPLDEVMDEVRRQTLQRVPGLDIELALLMEDLIGDLTAVPQPIEIKLFGLPDDELRAQADRVAAALEGVPNVVDVQTGTVLAGDALEIVVDRAGAELAGVEPERVARLAAIALDGAVATEIQRGEKMVGVRVWTAPEQRDRTERVRRLRVQTPDGRSMPLSKLARLRHVSGQPQIVREDLRTLVAVTGRISGRDMGSVIGDVQSEVAGLGLPAAVSVEYGGLYEQQQRSFRGLLAVLVAAVALVFVLLLFVYRRPAAAVAILLTDLLAASAVFSGLWWTDSELDISSMMGLTMIVGISSETAIFYMAQWQVEVGEHGFREALVVAGQRRARPILMTALAAILALLPLALAIGEGAGMLAPLAIAIISGLIVTVPLVLLVLPVIFATFSGSSLSS